MTFNGKIKAAVASALLLGSLTAVAAELPPTGSEPLSTILKTVEGQQSGVIAGAEFDDGFWEIKTCKAAGCTKLYIDPASGKESRRRATGVEEVPPAGSMLLSSIVQKIEAAGHGQITEVEFEDDQPAHWEVEIRNGAHKGKVLVNPKTGETLQ